MPNASKEKIKVKYIDEEGNKVKWKGEVNKIKNLWVPSKEGFDTYRQIVTPDYELTEIDPNTKKIIAQPRSSVVRHELYEMYIMTTMQGIDYVKAHVLSVNYQKSNKNDTSNAPGTTKGLRKKVD